MIKQGLTKPGTEATLDVVPLIAPAREHGRRLLENVVYSLSAKHLFGQNTVKLALESLKTPDEAK